MIQAVRNAFLLPDLRRRILFTLLMLVIYRAASHVPVTGVDREQLARVLGGQTAGAPLVGVLNLLSGGGLTNFSLLANGVYPYITASLVIQMLTGVIPALERLVREEGSEGRRKLEQYTYLLAIPMAMLQAIGQIQLFGGAELIAGWGIDPLRTITVIASMVAGTTFAIWISNLITEQGIGQGMSIIIFGGIVSRLPSNIASLLSDPATALQSLIAFIVVLVAVIFVIVIFQEGQRRIPVQYGKRVRGRKVYGGGATHIPLRVNTAGMIPLILAQSILTLPAIIANFFVNSTNTGVALFFQNLSQIFSGGRHASSWIYWLLYFLLVVGFTYFYTSVIMQQQNLADSLQKQGGFIPGIRPGKRTEEYITGVTKRITLAGALFLGMVAILPFLLSEIRFNNAPLIPNATNFSVLSTGLLIVVGVVLDTMRQLEAQLLMRHYEGFIK
ncbi:MAG TPA: preprotein translocase subunit SecY [Anaerolineae bacterium]|nr:preprotein translocase subunit SecY [Anaerolineae bacterium]